MTNDLSMALLELLRKVQMDKGADFLREGVQALAEALMELEITQHIGAGDTQYDAELARLRAQAVRLIKTLAALGRRLTAGKLAEAIGLDFAKHQRAWASVWFT